MKPVLIILTLFFIGCAHVGIVAFENRPEGQVFKLCGNRQAGPEDFEKAAGDHCGGSYKVLGGGVERAGSYTFGSASSYGNYASGSAMTVPIGMNCIVYQCGPQVSNSTAPSNFSDCLKTCQNLSKKIGISEEKCISDMKCM